MEDNVSGCFHESLEKDPDNIDLRRQFVRQLLREKKLQASVSHLKKILSLNPADEEAYLTLTDVYLRQDMRKEAEVLLEAASEQCANKHIFITRLRHLEMAPRQKAIISDENTGGHERVKNYELPYFEEIPPPLETIQAKSRPLTFADVGGMENIKEAIRLKVIYPLQNPDLFESFGKKAGGGILLYGPPGCGKTYIVQATVNESRAALITFSINDILSMYAGASEKNIHQYFETARRRQPAILFVDEVDALGAKRSSFYRMAGKTLVNQFLMEIDANSGRNDGVLIVGATNSPWLLDPAFKRPGRFDKLIFAAPPDRKARADIFRICCAKLPIEGNFDYDKLAEATVWFSGADIKDAVDRAAEMTIQRALRTGKVEAIQFKTLFRVVRKMQPSTKEWFETAKNHATFSDLDGHYKPVLDYLRQHKL